MGYCVSMTFINVRFKKEHQKEMVSALQHLNKQLLIPEKSWCRFPEDENNLENILCEHFSLEINEDETHGFIEGFWGEKLGHHEEIFRTLAPWLEDCEFKFLGEDDTAWKFSVVNGIAHDSIYREEF